jgi:hypothetical protein
MDDDGTTRHGDGLPGFSCVRIVAPPPNDATALVISLGDAAAPQSSIQRDTPHDIDVIAAVNAAPKNYGDVNAPRTSSQAGRALPGSDRCSAPLAFDTYQNISSAQAATASPRGTAGSGFLPRSAPDLGQRPQPLTDTPQPIPPPRKPVPLPPGYLPGMV